MRPPFALCRILGNETPPRDPPSGRLDVLAQLLREPPLPGVLKFWLLNRIWDPALAISYRRLLKGAGEQLVHEMAFEPREYFAAARRGEQLLYCPGINRARNEALRFAFDGYGARFAAAFDGDCGFTRGQWGVVLAEVFGDHVDGRGCPSYSVPSIRVDHSDWGTFVDDPSPPGGDKEEPMLIVGRAAWEQGIRYDESIPFGESDKVELLVRLGHSPATRRHNDVVRPGQCRNVGALCHINSNGPAVEGDLSTRMAARRESMVRLHADITRRYRGEAP